MIDKIKNTTISKICKRKLIYFNEKNIEKSKYFCKNLGITYLPGRDRISYYELVDDEFIARDLIPEAHCKLNDLIFSPVTLGKFKQNNADNVLFVTENEEIIGVVHIVDYNCDYIFFEFYKLLFAYEKMIRAFLELNYENNELFLDYILKKSESNNKKDREFWTNIYNRCNGENDTSIAKRKKKRSVLGQFQSFYLSDLIIFCNSKYFKIANQEAITRIRNKIAHSVDIIKQDKQDSEENDGHLYDFEGLTKFVNDVISFLNDYEYLEKKICELKSKISRKRAI